MSAMPPSIAMSLNALLRAEFLASLRNRRRVMWVLVFPPLAMVAGIGLSHATSASEKLAIAAMAMTLGTFAQGLFGHANAIAVARDRGVLVRLRCTPTPSWAVLLSRGATQVVLGLLGSAVVLVLAQAIYGVSAGPAALALAVPAVIAGAACALALGQLIAALAPSADEVNAVIRLAFFAVFLLGDLPLSAPHLSGAVRSIGEASPYYLAWRVSADALIGTGWSPADLARLTALVLAAAVLGWLGVRAFRWEPR
jgi:ABC-2 type transport system permease protein